MARLIQLLVLVLISIATRGCAAENNGRLMVLLLDGFRWDYVEKHDLTNFRRVWENGAKAGYMENDFPTLSYPNYYTLMTGLHTESHGMTGNYMYDPVTRKYFLIGTNADQSLPLWWENGEPLWVTAVKQGKSSYMYFWPGCEVTIQGHDPTVCDPYTHVPTMVEVGEVITAGFELLTNGTADMIGVYSEQPDYVGHKYGPSSDQTRQALKELDTLIGQLLDKMDQAADDTSKTPFNLVVLSDHGMTAIDPSRVINITEALNSEAGLYTTVMENAAVASIYTPNQQTEDKVYGLLKDFSPNMKVYRKSEIPDRFFYKNGPFVSRITCVADLGWSILQPLAAGFPDKGGVYMKGHHGFDNTEADMRGIFYAAGPYFQAGSKVDHIRAVDPYVLMCDILGLNPAPNNGTLTVFEPLRVASSGAFLFVSHLTVAMVVIFNIAFSV